MRVARGAGAGLARVRAEAEEAGRLGAAPQFGMRVDALRFSGKQGVSEPARGVVEAYEGAHVCLEQQFWFGFFFVPKRLRAARLGPASAVPLAVAASSECCASKKFTMFRAAFLCFGRGNAERRTP